MFTVDRPDLGATKAFHFCGSPSQTRLSSTKHAITGVKPASYEEHKTADCSSQRRSSRSQVERDTNVTVTTHYSCFQRCNARKVRCCFLLVFAVVVALGPRLHPPPPLFFSFSPILFFFSLLRIMTSSRSLECRRSKTWRITSRTCIPSPNVHAYRPLHVGTSPQVNEACRSACPDGITPSKISTNADV